MLPLVRLSVGCEEVDDLQADLEQAIQAARQTDLVAHGSCQPVLRPSRTT
jgi:hypothetical protein